MTFEIPTFRPGQRKLRSMEERFWAKVDKNGPNGCWLWRSWLTPEGYGYISISGRGSKDEAAHRFAYRQLHGEVPKGLEVHHICNNPSCVNPWHLKAISHKENVHLGTAPTAYLAKQTHCIHGHQFDAKNTRLYKARDGSRRQCRACDRERWRRLHRRLDLEAIE